MARLGRPPLTPGEHRVQVNTTVPLPVRQTIVDRDWQVNELIIDGITHRTECAQYQNTIAKLSQKIIDLGEELERLRGGAQ